VAINLQGSVTSQRVFIGGEVVRPGVQPLLGPLTVLQAVMVAEGLKDGAQAREVIVLRNDAQGERQVLRLDLKAVMAGQDGANDITLSPYDVVIVPRSGIANLGLWVDQYIRRVLPINLGFSYTVNRNGALQ
jgi:polysaccharide export outer membrane protein